MERLLGKRGGKMQNLETVVRDGTKLKNIICWPNYYLTIVRFLFECRFLGGKIRHRNYIQFASLETIVYCILWIRYWSIEMF